MACSRCGQEGHNRSTCYRRERELKEALEFLEKHEAEQAAKRKASPEPPPAQESSPIVPKRLNDTGWLIVTAAVGFVLAIAFGMLGLGTCVALVSPRATARRAQQLDAGTRPTLGDRFKAPVKAPIKPPPSGRPAFPHL